MIIIAFAQVAGSSLCGVASLATASASALAFLGNDYRYAETLPIDVRYGATVQVRHDTKDARCSDIMKRFHQDGSATHCGTFVSRKRERRNLSTAHHTFGVPYAGSMVTGGVFSFGYRTALFSYMATGR